MELDEYTKKLMERSRVRKEYLNKKVAEAKKRTALVDGSQIQEPNLGEIDESPKRQCLEYIDMEDNGNESEPSSLKSDNESENKENKYRISDDVPYVPFVAAQTRGLAALQKNKTLSVHDAETMDIAENCSTGSKVNTCNSSTSRSQNSRLAALAAHIREWEDDTTFFRRPVPSNASNSNKVTSAATALKTSHANSHFSSTICQSNTNITSSGGGAKNHKQVTFHPSCTVDGDRIATAHVVCDLGSMTGSKLSRAFNKGADEELIQKVHVWDQAILATLESQGFVKSPSKAKLLFEFPRNETDNKDTELINSDRNVTEADDMECNQRNSECEMLDKQDNKLITDALTKDNTTTSLNKAPKSCNATNDDQSTPNLNASTDPAELPLSARKALFEKAFCNSAPRQTENTIEPNLSVAQRAAMFEKVSVSPKKVEVPRKIIREPPKFTASAQQSPIKNNIAALKTSSNTKELSPVKGINISDAANSKAASPAKQTQMLVSTETIMSPPKNVGSHTRLMHQQLIENSSNDWRKKEIVAKACDERKNEISALLNHWEKVSSSSLENNSTDANQEQCKKSSSSESEKYMPVFQDIDEESDNSVCDDDDDDQNLELESNKTNSDGENNELSSQSDQGSTDDNSQPRNITSEAVAVCNEMDNILDEALEENLTMPTTVAAPLLSYDSISKSSRGSSFDSFSSSGSGSTSSYNQNYDYDCHTPVRSRSDQANETGADAPLLHTVSFYRRQKQEKRATPARTIVRRQEVTSPPSPESTNPKRIQEKIKALQQEILAQQTVISQTSQALNLCHSTEEFFGSTEQVEGERLLLIATQKRLAYINEMQRLKSQPANVKNGNGTLILNDIKLPLKRDFIALHLDGKGSDTVHYFLCIVRYGHQVIVTQMLSAEDGVKSGSLCFTNHITLHNLPPDFCVAFEVYALQTKKEVLPHDKKYHIKREHSKMRLNPKGKRSDSKLLSPVISSPGGPNAVRTPSFAVVGYTRFTLQNCDRQICTLEKVPFTSPLEGVLQLRMQLHAEHNITEKGFLTMFEDVSGFGAWHRRWCVLDGKDMAFWKYPDDEKRKEPILIIDLKQCITREVRLVSRDICARPHSFELVTVRPQEKGDKNTLISRSVNTLTTTKYLLSADTKEERIMWCKRLNDTLTNVRRWDPKAMRPVENKQDK